MNDSIHLQGSGGPRPILPGGPQAKEDSQGASPAFRLLLERLQEQASRLRESEPTQADELSGAVDAAGETLRDALTLRDRLLEAYRQTRHQVDSDR